MNDSTLTKDEAIAFFERYGSEFDNGKWANFASLFHEPCLTVRADGSVKRLQSRSDTAVFFENVAASWRSDGYHRFVMKNVDVMSMRRCCALVTFDWEMLNEKGETLKT